MKKHYALYSLLLIPALMMLLAYTSGGPNLNSGSPLDGQDCSWCHSPGPAIQVDGWIYTDIPPEGFTPGEIYTITVVAETITADKYGFQISCETTTEKTGIWILNDVSRTALAGAFNITHTTAGTIPQGTPNSWSMEWIAPVSGNGTVTFYAAVNKTNNDGTSSGDEIYTTSLSVNEANFGITENQLQAEVEVYPNPATTQLNMTLPVNSEIRIFDNNGREVMHKTSSNETEVFDVSALVNGMYFVHVSNNGQTASRSIIVR